MILSDNNGAKRGRQEERRKEHGRLHVVAPVEFRLRYGLKLNKVVTILNYLSRYNMATMMANNSKLLNNGEEEKKEEILKKLKGMDIEKLAAILKPTKLR